MMDPLTVTIIVVVPIVLTAIVSWLIAKSKMAVLEERVVSAQEQARILMVELEQERNLLNESKVLHTKMVGEVATLQNENKNLREKLDEIRNDVESQEQRFKNIANSILEDQVKRLDGQQKKGMSQILDPLKERLKSFEEKVERSNDDSIRRHESLKEQIKFLSVQSEKVSTDASNLAKALKGDFKKQGNWGELILESILEKSGLEKNREYRTQYSARDDDGKEKKPDVVIDLPDGKKLIIDSKVSLNAYHSFVNSKDEEEAIPFQQAHMRAVKNHIDALSQKNYHDLYKMESPDFVLMFIPIDTAFSAALSRNSNLYNYAFEKNIVIVTPSTLLATLKTVETMWRNDRQNRFALDIADEAGKMYDKFVGFIEDMEKIGKQINTVQNTYHTSLKKLHTGSGNLVGRARKIKQLGAKANKSLKKHEEEE